MIDMSMKFWNMCLRLMLLFSSLLNSAFETKCWVTATEHNSRTRNYLILRFL
jgi:hypothetical protein